MLVNKRPSRSNFFRNITCIRRGSLDASMDLGQLSDNVVDSGAGGTEPEKRNTDTAVRSEK